MFKSSQKRTTIKNIIFDMGFGYIPSSVTNDDNELCELRLVVGIDGYCIRISLL